MFTRVRRVSCGALAVAAAVLLSTSCGGPATANSGTISITVGALPVVDDVSAYIAQSEGIFAKNGLSVTLKQVLQSTLAIPMMQKGSLDIIGGGNYVSFIEQSAKDPANPPYRILSEAATCASGSFEVLALPSSGIQTPANLQHKTIAVNLTNNIQTLMINSVLKADDVNPSTVRYVQIPFPKMVAALQSHKVDAMSAVEPFATTAEQAAGAQPILDQCSGPDSNLPLSGYFSTRESSQESTPESGSGRASSEMTLASSTITGRTPPRCGLRRHGLEAPDPIRVPGSGPGCGYRGHVRRCFALAVRGEWP